MATRAQRRAQARRKASRLDSLWQRWKWWFIGGGAVGSLGLLVVLTSVLSGPEATGRDIPAVGGAAQQSSGPSNLPDFPVLLYQGSDILGTEQPEFASLLGGKPMVLNFWASNCAPCSAEMPEFEKVWQQYQDRVLFLGLDVGRFFPGYGDQAESKRELRRLGVTYPAGTPPTVQTVQGLQVRGLPSTLFIDANGALVRSWVGILNEAKLTEIIEGLLDGTGQADSKQEIGEAVSTLAPSHGPPFTYNTRPPTSGPHAGQPAAYGWHAQPLVAEQAVHNMEHGAVVIWFQPGDSVLAEQVNGLVGDLGNNCLVAGPYQDMEHRVAVTAWGRLLGLDSFDAEQIKAFVRAYRGRLGPEAGVCSYESGGDA